MKKTNYQKGRSKEYRLKKKYEMEGFIVLRTAGSHGFADLIAIHPLKKEIFFIQSKPRNFSRSQKEKLFLRYSWINDEFICKFKVE